MKFIVHIKTDQGYIPAVSFNDLNSANSFKNNIIKINERSENFTPNELRAWMFDSAPLIEESKNGLFNLVF